MFLITPNLPFMKKKDRRAPFYGLNTNLPILLAFILGFYIASIMLMKGSNTHLPCWQGSSLHL